jgi:hypothetical protein
VTSFATKKKEKMMGTSLSSSQNCATLLKKTDDDALKL